MYLHIDAINICDYIYIYTHIHNQDRFILNYERSNYKINRRKSRRFGGS